MLKIIIAIAVIFILAVILISVLYHFGFIDFYHPMKKNG